MGPKKQFKIIFRLVLLVSITAVALFCLNNHKVFAAGMDPNDTGIPGEVETDAEQSCDSTGNGIANPNWLSPTYAEAYPDTQPDNQNNDTSYDATSVYVAAGQTTTLFLNAADMFCNTGSQHYVYGNGVIWTGFIGKKNGVPDPLYSTQTTVHTEVDLYNLYSTTPGVTPSAILGTSYQNPPHACTPTADPNSTPGCDWKGDTLEVSPNQNTWFSGIDSIEFTIPAQAKGEQISLDFTTIGISQFQNGQFICVNNPGADHYDLYNFDGLYVPIGDPTRGQCASNTQEFTVYIDYDVTISGHVYTYNPLDGEKPFGGTDVVFTDTSNSNYSSNTTTDDNGYYEIEGIPLLDGFNISLLGNPNNIFISPNGGDTYDDTCTGTPAPTDPPWCSTPTYNNYTGQIAGEKQIIIKGESPPYNRGIDTGYDFVDPSSRIISKAVDTSGNKLPAGIRPVVKIDQTGETSDNNPYTFSDLLAPITGGTNSKYTIDNANPSLADGSNTYKLLGSNWCNTSVNCSPGTVGPTGDNWDPYTSGTASRSLTIPITDEPVVVYWDYELESAANNFDITGYTTASGLVAGQTTVYVTPGKQVKFDNYLTNLGPDTSTKIDYQVYLNATEIKDSSVNSIAATDSPDVYSNTVDTTGNANGTKYCEFIEWQPINATGGSGAGSLICAIVQTAPSSGFNITGYTTVSGEVAGETTVYVTPGTQVKFDNYLTNLGPDTSPQIFYEVYLNAEDIKNSSVNSIAATDSPDVYSNTVNTTGDPNGTEYCEFIEFNPDDITGDFGSGSLVCAIVQTSPGAANFDITGYTTVSGETEGETTVYVTPGTQVKFDNYLTNLGPDTSTKIDYQVYLNAEEIKNSSVNSIAATDSPDVYSNTVNTTGDPNGTHYCEFIAWEPVNANGGNGSGTEVCAIVETTPPVGNNFDITGLTTVSSATVTPGGSVVFHNYLSNIGDERSSLINYSVYRGVILVDPSTAALNPGGPYNVYSETYHVPLGTAAGTVICENITWTPVTNTNDGPGVGVPACTTVKLSAIDCPGFPNFASVPINLPDNTTGLAVGPPPNDSQSPDATWAEIIPENNFEITGLTDVSATTEGGNSVLPNISPAVGVKTSDSTAVSMDYSPYVQTYPYDINEPAVSYENFYDRIVWTSGSTPIFYSCSNPLDTVNGHNDCTHTTTSSYPAQFNAGDDGWFCVPPTDPVGSVLVGHTCVLTTTVNDGPATPWYAWSEGPTTVVPYAETPVNGTVMPACYNRTFSLNGTDDPTNTATFDNTEDPTLLTVTGNVQADYDVTNPDQGIGFREPTQVTGVDTEITIEVYHENDDGSLSGPNQNYYYNVASGNLKSTYVSTSTDYSSSQDYTIPWSYGVALPPLTYGDEICVNLTTNPSVGQVAPNSWTPQDITTQLANQQWANNPWPTDATDPPPAVCTQYLAAGPYLKVYGGDVSAGTATDINNQDCTDLAAGISTWNQDIDPYAGAGTQLAAFAANVITGFASAQNDTGSNSSPPIGLTFSNTTGGTYGGDFGASTSDCSTDYYAQGITTANTDYSDAGAALTAALGGPAGNYAYQVNGGTIDATNIPLGYNIAIYSSGPITIDGNITYGGVSTTLSQMPNLEIVTDTDTTGINIDHNVAQLAGVYVAEGNGGIINDCADVLNIDDWYGGDPNCAQQLIVEGSFTANALYLSRTYGSVHEATSTEPPCISGAANCTNAAEEFDYSPATWLTYPNQSTAPVVQSINSLPPVL